MAGAGLLIVIGTSLVDDNGVSVGMPPVLSLVLPSYAV